MWTQMYLPDPSLNGAIRTIQRNNGNGSVTKTLGAVTANHYCLDAESTLRLTLEEDQFGLQVPAPYLEIVLPVNPATGLGWQVVRRHRTLGLGLDRGVPVPIMAVGMPDERVVRVYRTDLAPWQAGGMDSAIFTQWTGEVY